MPNKKSIALIVILFLILTVAFTANGLYQKTAGELAIAKQKIQEVEAKLGKSQETITATTTAINPAIEMKLASLATDTRELLVRSPLLNILSDVREISPGVVIALIERQKEDLYPYEMIYRNSSYATVWLFDLHDNTRFKQLQPEIDISYGNAIRLGNWLHGTTIEIFTSPGEALRSIQIKYVDAVGDIVAETYSGDYEKLANSLEIQVKEKKFDLQLVQKSKCIESRSTYGGVDFPPTTTLVGIEVNGKLFAFPHPTISECDIGYDESVGEPVMPNPYFDGERMSFHLSGIDVTFSSDGTIRYSPTHVITYAIPCTIGSGPLRLLREDQSGIHRIIPNIWNDPLLAKLNTDQYCFDTKELKGNIASFQIQKNGEYGFVPAGTVNYNVQTGTFENLVMNE